MRRQLLDVEHAQAVRGEGRGRRVEREVREVLVVDRVELVALDEADQVRELDRDRAARREQHLEAAGDVVQVGHVRVDVVGDDQVRRAVGGEQGLRERDAEELRQRRDALGARGLGDVAGRVDAQDGDPAGDEVAEEVAVVAGHLDDPAVGPQAEPLDHGVGELTGVLDPGVGEGREVRVLAEDLVGRHVLGQLDQEAVAADPDVERVEGLHLVELGGRQEPLAQRRCPEIDERGREGHAAQAARGPGRGRGVGRCVVGGGLSHGPECIRRVRAPTPAGGPGGSHDPEFDPFR